MERVPFFYLDSCLTCKSDMELAVPILEVSIRANRKVVKEAR